MQPIHVRYTLAEYLSFVREHALTVGNKERETKGKPPVPKLSLTMR